MEKRRGSHRGSQKDPRQQAMEADVEAFLIESGMERVRRYLREGRRFQALDGADVRSEWVAAFKKIAVSPVDPEFRKRGDDLQDEMELRGIKPPYDEVKQEFEAFIGHADQAIERLKTDPERWSEMNEELQADIDAVKAKREKAAKN